MSTQSRKDSHIHIVNDEAVAFQSIRTGFERYRFDHDPSPELDYAEIDTRVKLFGKPLKAPFIFGAMTGGTDLAAQINQRLARVAQAYGIGIALGSMRVLLEHPGQSLGFKLREEFPEVPFIMGNIGAVQLNYKVVPHDVQKLVELGNCDAIAVHFNPLQEAIQPEGDRNFKGLTHKLEEVCDQVKVPVVAKETGAGIGGNAARRFMKMGFKGIEVSGAGGTSWSRVEAFRAEKDVRADVGKTLGDWGIPTSICVKECAKVLPASMPLIAAGGLQNGHDITKSIALGATIGAMAAPFLKAALESDDALAYLVEQTLTEIKTVMFCTGSKNVDELRSQRLVEIYQSSME